jgi:hypothetical protein
MIGHSAPFAGRMIFACREALFEVVPRANWRELADNIYSVRKVVKP